MALRSSRPVTFAVHGPIDRDDLPGLCNRVCALLSSVDTKVVVCLVKGVAADAVTVDALARLQLAAQSSGCTIRLGEASGELRQLVAFMGLRDVLAE